MLTSERSLISRPVVFAASLCLTLALPASAASQVVRDSAGVRILTYTLAQLRAAPSILAMDSTPVLRIGAVDGPPGAVLNQVRAVAEGPTGRIALADNEGTVVRLYEANGRYIGTQGSEGDGPGEYRRIVGLTFLPGDSLAVFDQGTARLSVIGPDFRYARSAPLPIPATRIGAIATSQVYSLGLLRAVKLSAEVQDPRRLMDPQRNMNRRVEQERLALVMLRPAGGRIDVDTLLQVPGMSLFIQPREGGERRTSLRFGAVPFLSGNATGFVVAHGSSFELKRFDAEGRLTQIIRLPAQPRAVTAQDREASGPTNESTVFSEVHPLIKAVELDGNGNVWVTPDESIAQGRGWIVFGQDGRARAWSAYLSPHGGVRYIGTEYVFAVSSDALDVQYLSKYRLPLE